MKFILVQLFNSDTCDPTVKYKPFWINLAHIRKVVFYDTEVYSAVEIDVNGKRTYKTAKGALETIFIHLGRDHFHLDPKSSKKVLAAIKSIKRGK
jgi:hypothetical protein